VAHFVRHRQINFFGRREFAGVLKHRRTPMHFHRRTQQQVLQSGVQVVAHREARFRGNEVGVGRGSIRGEISNAAR
jgi:hypothetical protein